MSCIYKYKGKKYSEEQFKEYFINNKQEFATSIVKNKDVIDSFKRKMEGIDFVFSQSPELASIGSKAQYLQYLSTIFKTSKVKDIVYHGTPFEFDKFKKPLDIKENIFNQHTLAKEEDNPHAIYFQFEPRSFRKGKVVSAIINSRDLIKKENYSGYSISYATGNRQKLEQQLNSKTFDALDITPLQGKRELLVFEPEQIHILGSKQDIEGFKDFVQGKQFQKLTAEEKAKTIEQVTKEHRSIAALKDLSAKLAHRIGGRVQFENRTDVDWKGYNQGMTSVLNEAYMTLDTPFHEIAFHPIIRALKSISSQKESVTLQQMINYQEIEKICS
jgi:hypothetical protein